jgi:hypothetical protein
LLVMAGDETAASGPFAEAIEELRTLRDNLLAPASAPVQG